MTPSIEHSSADQNIADLLMDQEAQTLQTSSPPLFHCCFEPSTECTLADVIIISVRLSFLSSGQITHRTESTPSFLAVLFQTVSGVTSRAAC